ncbi:radical SAM protein [Thermoleptolyngbya sp. C42_A2020_037]|uniref:radical SAM protein n=1 Tax=Thermoleptolyngbya sp. C42_A2020_037 TaxID=2747799 RepID=UPI001A01F17F|nr:radical SAM protein [Thermoleptolyngbya sp. C42_A2020_037]MBF2085719.1 radical SAM protein [Thermoleptolyngbya sp. C42_A2020_037]
MQLKHLSRLATRHLYHKIPETLYLTTGHDYTRPLSIRGFVNERCNYRCKYCGFWRMSQYQDEMTISEWQSALQSLKEFVGSYSIQFVGGEPFIKRGFIDLLEFCCTNKIDWGVITNGSAFCDPIKAWRTAKAKPINIDISVDSSIEEIHDKVRGITGSLKQIETGIKLLRDARDRLNLKFPIRIKPTVHCFNVKNLPTLAKWSREIGATTIDFSPVRPAFGLPEIESELWLRDELDLQALEESVEALISLKQQGYPIETSNEKLRSFAAHFRGEKVYHGVSPCRVGLRDYHIQPNGDVTMCWFYPAIGNVKSSSAQDLWQSETARSLRTEMVNCTKFGSTTCANSCLSHRTMFQKFQLGMLFLKSVV